MIRFERETGLHPYLSSVILTGALRPNYMAKISMVMMLKNLLCTSKRTKRLQMSSVTSIPPSASD